MKEVAEGLDLLAQVRELQRRALDLLDQAEQAGNLRAALSAIREARGNLALVASLTATAQRVVSEDEVKTFPDHVEIAVR